MTSSSSLVAMSSSQMKSVLKPVELNSIINVVRHDEGPDHARSKMELKSVVHVAHTRSNSSRLKKREASSQSSSKSSKLSTEKPFLLDRFGHQVSGRASMLCYNEVTILKPYVSRELYYYQTQSPDLKIFTPEFRGLITVSFIEETATGSVLAYALPGTLIKPQSQTFQTFIEKPKPHSKRCVKDFGKTHVIFPPKGEKDESNPSNPDPLVPRLPVYDDSTLFVCPNDFIRDENDDVVSKLSQGFDNSVRIDEKKYNDSQSLSTGLQNPWNSKVLDEAWLKLKEHNPDNPNTGKKKRFALLENVASRYRYPCVLDLKIGTRVRENASAEKLARHVTAINLGVRLSGMQVYHPAKKEFTYHNKYYGHNLTVSGFNSNLRHFFSRGKILIKGLEPQNGTSPETPSDDSPPCVDEKLVQQTIKKLTKLQSIVTEIKSHRFYSSSVLLLYEGEINEKKAPEEAVNDETMDCQIEISDIVKSTNEHPSSTDPHSKMPGKSFSFSDFILRLKNAPQKVGAPESVEKAMAETKTHEKKSHSKVRSHSERHHHSLRSNDSKGQQESHDDHATRHNSSVILHDCSCTTEQNSHNTTHHNSRHSTKLNEHNESKKDKHQITKHDSWPPPSRHEYKHRCDRAQPAHGGHFLRQTRHHPHHCETAKTKTKDAVGGSRDLKRRHRDSSADDIVDVKMIDFAHYCFHDNVLHPGPDRGFLFGLENLIDLLNEMLIS